MVEKEEGPGPKISAFPAESRIGKRDMVSDYISVVVDHNADWGVIDERMMSRWPGEWAAGDARKYYRKYARVREDVKAARAIALREAGADKVMSIAKYVEAQDAVKVNVDGSESADHMVRMQASDRLLTMMGERVSGGGAGISIHGSDQKIMIISSSGKDVGDMV
jgi:hypothetical protein